MKAVLFLASALINFVCYGVTPSLEIRSYGMPSQEVLLQAKSLARPIEIHLCCYFPEQEEVASLLQLKELTSLSITAGAFPNEDEARVLATLNIPLFIEIDNVIPSENDAEILNLISNLKEVKISYKFFPISSEVSAFNLIKTPLYLNLTMSELPLPEHMDVLQNLKDDTVVGFNHSMVPGIGYVEFFNSLPNPKIWTVRGQFPWGDDYLGFNALKNARVNFIPNEKLMPQDVEELSRFNSGVSLELGGQAPYDEVFLGLLSQLKVDRLTLNDQEAKDFLTPMGSKRVESFTAPLVVIF